VFIRQPTQRRGVERARLHSSHRPRRHLVRGVAGNTSGDTVWLFDLDNTLHDASHAIFPAINRLMTAYVARVLGCDDATASRVRVDYWQRYGATLLGMVRHHQVDPADFLRAAHDFPSWRTWCACDEVWWPHCASCRGGRSWSRTHRATTRAA
jgi:putative hydrolase of the HAD superfamily